MSNRKPLSQNILLSLGTLLFCLLMLEVGLRIYHGYVKIVSPYQPAEDPEMIYVVKPGIFREVNSRGFRDREHPLEKAPGSFRLLIIGDSVTRGYGVAPEERYTDILQQRFIEGGQPYEVVNFGFDQYATVQETALLDEWGVPMRPDRVIISYVLNDPEPDGSINGFFLEDRVASIAFYWLSKKLNQMMPADSRESLEKECHYFDYYSRLHCSPEKWQKVRQAFRKIRELSIRHDFPVLLVIFPVLSGDLEATFSDYPWKDIHQRVLAEAKINGFETLDLLPYFAEYTPGMLKLNSHDALHPNPLGHRIAADAIYEKLMTH